VGASPPTQTFRLVKGLMTNRYNNKEFKKNTQYTNNVDDLFIEQDFSVIITCPVCGKQTTQNSKLIKFNCDHCQHKANNYGKLNWKIFPYSNKEQKKVIKNLVAMIN
jgi:ribosomal protein L37AE/L43A